MIMMVVLVMVVGVCSGDGGCDDGGKYVCKLFINIKREY